MSKGVCTLFEIEGVFSSSRTLQDTSDYLNRFRAPLFLNNTFYDVVYYGQPNCSTLASIFAIGNVVVLLCMCTCVLVWRFAVIRRLGVLVQHVLGLQWHIAQVKEKHMY